MGKGLAKFTTQGSDLWGATKQQFSEVHTEVGVHSLQNQDSIRLARATPQSNCSDGSSVLEPGQSHLISGGKYLEQIVRIPGGFFPLDLDSD